jgi:Uma2 family endonuclease
MAIAQIHFPVKRKTQAFEKFITPLESGEHLTRAEFERRYEADPDTKKAELVEGVVHMPSPVSAVHGKSHSSVIAWLSVYAATVKIIQTLDNTTVVLDVDNEVQPDALLRLEKFGRTRLNEKGYIVGAPELIVEIAVSSAGIDLYAKKNIYRRNGVQEYLVWQIRDERMDWFELRDEEYKLIAPGENGILHSRVFPGLWLAADAMLDGDLKQVLDVLQRGLASEEHREFVNKLTSMHTEEISE